MKEYRCDIMVAGQTVAKEVPIEYVIVFVKALFTARGSYDPNYTVTICRAGTEDGDEDNT